jgi:SAM-dependent methyltransferase
MGLVQALHPVLSYPPAYKMAMRILGGDSARRKHVNNYIRPKQGDKVIDLGCGPCDMLAFFPPVDYTGIDSESKYIDDARSRFGNKGKFNCKDIAELRPHEYSNADIVMSNSVIHHLSDKEFRHLLELARSFLKPEGRLVTLDGCFLEGGQHPFDLWMLRNDRGKFVRKKDEYIRIAKETFPRVEAHVISDLLRVPYTLIVMECSFSK